MKPRNYMIIALVVFLAGFLAGRITVPYRTEVRYEKQAVQQGSYVHHQLVPVKVESPGLSVMPAVPLLYWAEGQDTVEIIREVEKEIKVDTLAVLSDYLLKRTYKETLFDNEQGRFDLTAEVQYNRMTALSYDYVPLKEIRTTVSKPVWQPYVGAGYATNRTLCIGGGVFYHNLGVDYTYHFSLPGREAGYHAFKLMYKFR